MRMSLSIAGVLVLLGFNFVQAGTSGNEERVEVPIGHLFLPSQVGREGEAFFVVLDGVMPNGCYRLADHPVSIDRSERTFTLRLHALRQVGGICADEDSLPSSLWTPVPYTLEARLGLLLPGEYRVSYSRPGLPEGGRTFQVETRRSNPQEVRYADVSAVFIQDRVPAGREIFADLRGEIRVSGSACSALDIGVRRDGEVLLISPRVESVPGRSCEGRFRRKVSLGRLEEGRYLIHVLSSEGRSLNRAFNALARDP